MSQNDKVIITCALTGVLTNPKLHRVPVTPEQMALEARRAFDSGAAIVHVHCRNQDPDLGHLPSFDPDVCDRVISAIKNAVPEIIINLSTGIMGMDISGPTACIKRIRPEYAACNAGTLNYLKIKNDGAWAWPPLVFDNPVEKIQGFLDVMQETGTRPEFECFDTGHVRSIALFEKNGMVHHPSINFVMGVQSGMPLKPHWLPLLLEEIGPATRWQVTAIGRKDVWPLHRRAAELGGNLRSGLEDTFYLDNGDKVDSNAPLIEALARLAQETGRTVASASEARAIMGFTSY
ncbi:MAG: 3-keto-5-aminohexanoate cleavage protein [Deltaproteobacteria bacterium]|nr:3-keto-5-aminohexanoate cleavage protein [Deltaproteobacteria bacterium]